MVLSIIDNGLRLPWKDGPPTRRIWNARNYVKNAEFAAWLRKAVLELLVFGAVEKIAAEAAFFVSPLGVVEKPSSTPQKRKYRLIHDLRALNKLLKKFKFALPSLGQFRHLLRARDWLFSIDLTSAYYHLEICKEHRQYFAFEFEGSVYQWVAMPFGLSVAPYLYTRVTSITEDFIRRQLGVRLLGYIDDFLGALQEQDQDKVSEVVECFRAFGWEINVDKCHLQLTHDLVSLGFGVNTADMVFYIPEERKAKLLGVANEVYAQASARQPVRARLLMRFVGHLVSCKLVIGDACLLYSRHIIFDFGDASRTRRFDMEIELSDISVKLIGQWCTLLHEFERCAIHVAPFQPSIRVEADTSETATAAIVTEIPSGPCYRRIHRLLEDFEIGSSSTRREMLGYAHAARSLPVVCADVDLRGRDILFDVDSLVSVCVQQRAGSQAFDEQSGQLAILLDAIDLFEFQREHGCRVRLRWRRREELMDVDDLSKIEDHHDYSLAPSVMEVLRRHLDLDRPCWVDRFANARNAVCPRFCSRFASDACEEFDSLLCSWEPARREPVKNWIFPPVPLIPRVVDKLLMEQCEFVLIVPQWRSRPWFQALEEFVFPRAQLFMLVPPGSVVDNNGDAFFTANGSGQFNVSMVVVHFVP